MSVQFDYEKRLPTKNFIFRLLLYVYSNIIIILNIKLFKYFYFYKVVIQDQIINLKIYLYDFFFLVNKISDIKIT